MTDKTLGLLALGNRPVDFAGALSAPGTLDFALRTLAVPDAWTRNVVEGDPSVKDGFIAAARQLEAAGVAAIISNCGFTSLFQAEVAAAVRVPVALSSLLLVPLMARTLPPGLRVGVITYDAAALAEEHFAGAGWSSSEIEVRVAGIDGSETWRALAQPVPAVTREMLISDVMEAVLSLVKTDPSIGALVLECAAFPAAAETVRRDTGLPVADYVSLAKLVVEMSPQV
jgi:Asp/Glu/hydantoin racemase